MFGSLACHEIGRADQANVNGPHAEDLLVLRDDWIPLFPTQRRALALAARKPIFKRPTKQASLSSSGPTRSTESVPVRHSCIVMTKSQLLTCCYSDM